MATSHGKDGALIGSLREIMTGSTLLIRYYTIDERSHDVEFSLAGARHAIAEVTGLAATPTAEEVQKAERLNAQRLEASARFRECVKAVRTKQEIQACRQEHLEPLRQQ